MITMITWNFSLRPPVIWIEGRRGMLENKRNFSRTNTVTTPACAATKHQPRPHDLVGSWALETSGWNGLSDKPMDGSTAEAEDLGLNDLVVAFRKDGTVQVPVDKGVGLQWKVEPGPTHLDTVYFEMIPTVRIMTPKCVNVYLSNRLG